MKYNLPEELQVRAEAPIRIVTLNRPEARNAVDKTLHAALARVWDQLAEDAEARAVVLTGAGRAFCGGGDMQWFRELAVDQTERRRGLREAKAISRNQLNCPVPI